jgi:hypothetical protein
VTYTNNTAIGTATARATYAGDANHAGSTGTSSFAITAPFAIVNPGPQVSTEGDKVSLGIQEVGATSAGGVFAATGLPDGLQINKQGVIRGNIKKHTAGVYQVTVTFTQGGITASQTFSWTILLAQSGRDTEENDE